METCKEIIERLQADDHETLREAAFRAGEEDCQEAIPRLAQLLSSESIGVQEAAELTLRKLGGSSAVRAVVPLLWSENVPVRNVAMDILRDIGNHDLDSLTDLLVVDDVDVRIFAADILGHSKSILAVRPLCKALLTDPDVNVRYQAAVSLGNLRHHEAATCLNQALDDEEWVQFAVIEALKKIRDESSVDALMRALGRASDLVASIIVEALGEMGNIKAVPQLLKNIDQAPVPLRNKMVLSLVKILGSKTLSLLSKQDQAKFLEYLLEAIGDNEQEVQDAAVMGLKWIGGERAARAIFDLILRMDEEHDEDRLTEAIRAMQYIGVSDILISAVKDQDEHISGRAIKILTGIDRPEARKVLIAVFWDKNRDFQREISKHLSLTSGPEVREFFLDILERHDDGTVLKNALFYLGNRLQDQDSAHKVMDFLEHRFNDVKEVALEACIELATPEVKSRFLSMLGSVDPVQRMMGVYGLGKLGDPECFSQVKNCLQDEVEDVRKVALEASFDLLGEDDRLFPLVVAKLDDRSREVRITAIKILSQFRSKGIEEYLVQALKDDDDWVKIRALDSLVRGRVAPFIDEVIAVLESENQLLKIKAVEALGKIGGEKATQALLNVLDTDDPEVLEAAERALAHIAGK